MKELLFVYGTLLKGFSNHRIIADAEFVGKAVTIDRFTMYSNNRFPALDREPKCHIVGELYLIDDKIMQRTDYLEGYRADDPKHSFYIREVFDVIDLHTLRQKQAWIYYVQNKSGLVDMYETDSGNFPEIMQDMEEAT